MLNLKVYFRARHNASWVFKKSIDNVKELATCNLLLLKSFKKHQSFHMIMVPLCKTSYHPLLRIQKLNIFPQPTPSPNQEQFSYFQF